MDIISAKEAKAKGLKFYFTGKPCKNGHIDKRYVHQWCCVSCKREQARQNYSRNPNSHKIRMERYKEKIGIANYRQKVNTYIQKVNYYNSESYKKWVEANRDKIRERSKHWMKQKRKKDPYFQLSQNVKGGIWRSLKGNKNGKKWLTFVDFTLEELILHLENQFDEKTSWDNYGSYWHVDHIKPLAKFNLETEFKDAWNINNLQPLEKIANIKKNDKYEEN